MKNKNYPILTVGFVLILLAVTTRFANIGAQGLLCDETWVVPNTFLHLTEESIFPKLFTYEPYLNLSTTKQDIIRKFYNLHPLFQIAASQVSDAHPPLFFFLNYYWSKIFGYSVESIRTPSALYFLLNIFVLFLLLKRQKYDFNHQATILLFVIITPVYLFFSNFARMYSLLLFLSLLSSYFAYELAVTNFKRRTLILYVTTSIACLYTHYYSALVILTHIVFLSIELLFFNKQKTNFLKMVIAEAAIFIFFFPWLIVVYLQYKYRYPLVKEIYSYFDQYALAELICSFGFAYSPKTLFSYQNIIISLVQFTLFILGITTLFKKRRELKCRFWLIYFLCPLFAIVVVNILKPVFTVRNSLILLIPYLAIGGIGLNSISRKKIIVAILLLLVLPGLYYVFYGLPYENTKGEKAMEDWRSTGRFITEMRSEYSVYVYPECYRDALYYYIPNEERIKALSNDLLKIGPKEKHSILVFMKAEEGDIEKIIKRDLPFYSKTNILKIKLIEKYPHNYIYQIIRID
jgi:uncharacterized membrane protein